MVNQLAEGIIFSGIIENGFCWDELSRKRMKNSKALESYGYKVYSQNDEDGIIHEIFNRIGTTNKKFVEFGVQDGLESNCHLLLFYGWSGLWIEGSEEFCRKIKTKFRPVIEEGQLKIKRAFITKENINELLKEMDLTGEVDLLSIDIDGNDWYVWEAIEVINPRVVIIEYNGKFPPDLEWKQAYNPNHIWDGTDWHGASLKALENLGRIKGYQLVGTNLRGCNAFFVRDNLTRNLFYKSTTSEELYNPLRIELKFIANHPSKYCLAKQKDYLGILNYQDYELVSGFHTEEHIGGGVECHVWTSKLTSQINLLIRKDIKVIEIPVRCAREVLGNGYNLIISGSEVRKYDFTMLEENNTCKLFLNEVMCMERIIELKVKVPFTWKPCDYMNSQDQRSLGIDIILSEIKMF